MTDINHAKIVEPGGGDSFAVMGDVYRFLATGGDTNARYAIWEATLFPGGGPPMHVHSREHEGFYVIEGRVTFFVEETEGGEQRRHEVGPGTFLNLPPGVWHGFRNETDAEARMLIMVSPAGLDSMFYRIGRPVKDATANPGPPSDAEVDALIEEYPDHGLKMRPPKR